MAFDGWLPDDLLWRKKTRFGDGSGDGKVAASVLRDRVTGSVVEDDEFERRAVDPPCALARRSPTTASSPKTSAGSGRSAS